MAHLLFIIIIVFVVFDFVLERLFDYLNSLYWSNELPKELAGIYEAEKYKKSQDYEKAQHKFGMYSSALSFLLIMAMLLFKGFAYLDDYARSFTDNDIFIALIFFGIIGIASDIISTPLQIYDQFVIEEKYGFNKTTWKTFVLDKIKSWVLGALIGGGLLAFIVWIYNSTGEYFWLIAWGSITVFMIFMAMFFSSLIVPLFNKQTPLEDGELRDAIKKFADKAGFKLDNIFVIDGSKRSTKANAYFSGLGAKKRIVLYDTLIKDHTIEELVAILAHEIGHYKKKHTLKGMIMSVIQTGIMLYIISLFVGNPVLSEALGAKQGSFHVGILAFGMLYSPLSLILGIFMNIISRKNEYEADSFAVQNYSGKALKDALIKLSVNTLSNLRPHPVYVFFHYSHPPLIQRLKAIDEAGENIANCKI
ncbi:MAG: M48 family metallopeptidase [Bacteroidetes bacterium]|nr:M48 family metallopeptidase [Bacteroidota bacterium]